MRKLAVVLGISALALVGCGERTLTEAEARIGGPVAEDHNHFLQSFCDFETDKLVIDAKDDIWLDRHAPICQEKGTAMIGSAWPFGPKVVEVQKDEVDKIERVESVDPEMYRQIWKIKVQD